MIISSARTWKEEREKQKAQGKGINHRSYFVLVIKTLREYDHIMFDSRTIKRGKTRIEIRLSKCY